MLPVLTQSNHAPFFTFIKKISSKTHVLLISVSLTVALILLHWILNSVAIVFSTFVGAMLAYFVMYNHTLLSNRSKAQESLLQIAYVVDLIAVNNAKLTAFLETHTKNHQAPWEKIPLFMQCLDIPSFELEYLLRLKKQDTYKLPLLTNLLRLKNEYKSVSTLLSTINHRTHVAFERTHVWETKIKTLKGLRARDDVSRALLKEKIGKNLYEELTYLAAELHCLNTRITHLCDVVKGVIETH